MTGQDGYRNRMTHCKVSSHRFLRGNYKETTHVERKTLPANPGFSGY